MENHLEIYGGHKMAQDVIACEGNNDWPAPSPDLSACDLSVWDIWKVRYLRVLPDFHWCFETIWQVSRKAVRDMRDLAHRAALCVEREGGHVEGTIWQVSRKAVRDMRDLAHRAALRVEREGEHVEGTIWQVSLSKSTLRTESIIILYCINADIA